MSDLPAAFHHSGPCDARRAGAHPAWQSVTASTRTCDTCPRYTAVVAAGFESDLAYRRVGQPIGRVGQPIGRGSTRAETRQTSGGHAQRADDRSDCQSFRPSIPAGRPNVSIIRTPVLRYADGSAPFCRRVEGS